MPPAYTLAAGGGRAREDASRARFIKKVFAADPLVCPDCGGQMRIIAFIEGSP